MKSFHLIRFAADTFERVASIGSVPKPKGLLAEQQFCRSCTCVFTSWYIVFSKHKIQMIIFYPEQTLENFWNWQAPIRANNFIYFRLKSANQWLEIITFHGSQTGGDMQLSEGFQNDAKILQSLQNLGKMSPWISTSTSSNLVWNSERDLVFYWCEFPDLAPGEQV